MGRAFTAVTLALGLGVTLLAGCTPSPDLQNPPILLQQVTTEPDESAQPSTTATPEPQETQGTTDPAIGETSGLTAENFAETVGAAMAAKGSVHMEVETDVGFYVGNLEADYVLWAQEGLVSNGTAGMAVTVPFVLDEVYRYVLTPDEIFIDAGTATDNKYYVVRGGWSSPLAADVQSTVDTLDIEAHVRALDGTISEFAQVGKPINVRGSQAQEYVITVPTAVVADQLGLTYSAKVAESLEGMKGDPLVDKMFDQRDENLANVPTSIEFHYWLNRENLPVKVTYEASTTTNEMFLSKWGLVKPIVTPSGDELGGTLG